MLIGHMLTHSVFILYFVLTSLLVLLSFLCGCVQELKHVAPIFCYQVNVKKESVCARDF